MKSLLVSGLPLFSMTTLITACTKEPPCQMEPQSGVVKFEVVDYLPDSLHSFEGLKPKSVSISFYPTDNKESVVLKFNSEQGKIPIDKGQYNILIHTSDFYDVDANFYIGMENIDHAESHTRQRIGDDGVITMSEPDPLFAAYIERYTIGTSFDNIEIEFRPLVYTYRFSIDVEGLGYVKSAKAQITGLYSSVYLKNGLHRQEQVAQMVVNLSKINGNKLCGEFRSFGAHQRLEVEHTLTVALINSSGETKTEIFNNLTQRVKALPKGGEFFVDRKIVIENGGSDGGFKPGVDDWDDDKRPLPI